MSKNFWYGLGGLVVGALAGYLGGVLTAPASGEETVGEIKKAVEEGMEKTKGKMVLFDNKTKTVTKIFGQVSPELVSLYDEIVTDYQEKVEAAERYGEGLSDEGKEALVDDLFCRVCDGLVLLDVDIDAVRDQVIAWLRSMTA